MDSLVWAVVIASGEMSGEEEGKWMEDPRSEERRADAAAAALAASEAEVRASRRDCCPCSWVDVVRAGGALSIEERPLRLLRREL